MLSQKVIPFAKPGKMNSEPPTWLSVPVVQIGHDEELLRLRARILCSAGFSVYSALPEEVTALLPRAERVQIWMFCHTLQLHELASLAAAIRSNSPNRMLLRLTGLDYAGPVPNFFDELFDSTRGVDELLTVVSRLMRRPTGTRLG